jgi:lipopolysaccharide transport system permease protein
VIPDQWRLLYSLNPMVGVIDAFRWAICGSVLYLPGFLLSLVVIGGFLWLGVWYFRRTEKVFADVI